MKYPLLLILLLLPSALAATVELSLDPVIIQGDTEKAFVLVSTPTKFNGKIELSYSNMWAESSLFTFTQDDFEGPGPYLLTYEWDSYGVNVGDYELHANLKYLNNTLIDAHTLKGDVNTSSPYLTSIKPVGLVPSTSTTIEVSTNEKSRCKYGTENKTYDDMSTELTVTGLKDHTHVITGLDQGKHIYYVICKDLKGYGMKDSTKIEFTVDRPPSAEVTLSDESPLKAGTVAIKVVTSEHLEEAPTLEYSFNTAPTNKRIISLTGHGTSWEGFMIITEDDDNTVGTFHFTGIDSIGTRGHLVNEGKIFLVDTKKPSAPVNIETVLTPEGYIKLDWYYEGEPIDGYNIYRSTNSGVEYIDFYVATDNGTQFTDKSVSNQVTYYYKVAAIDKARNIGDMSPEVYSTSLNGKKEEKKPVKEEPKVLPPERVLELNDEIKKAQQLAIDLKEIIYDSFDEDVKKLYVELDAIKKLSETKAEIKQIEKQLDELKKHYMTKSELDSEIQKYTLQMNQIRKNTLTSVKLLEKSEYIQKITEEELKTAVDKIFSTMEDTKAYVKQALKILDDINIEVTIRSYQTEFLDDSTNDETLVDKKISYLKPEVLQDVIVLENIPVAFASTNNLDIITKGYEIIEQTLKWGFLNLNFEGERIKYKVQREVDMNTAKQIRTVVLIGPAFLDQASPVTGYSVFEGFELGGWETLIIYLGIGIVILLLGYYLVFVKDISFKGKPIKEFPHVLKLTSTTTNTDVSLIKKLIQRTQEHITMDDLDKASELYPKVQILYRDLPKEAKKEIYPECVAIQKAIVEKDPYKSIF